MLKNLHQSNHRIYKYFLIGSNGLLGNELKKILPKKDTICSAKKNSDININLYNLKNLEKIFNKFKFQNVLNVVAETDINKCEKNKLNCKKINLDLPIKLAALSQKHNFKLIQLSTDQVYRSKNFSKNKEGDKTSYYNYYSKTKFLAENNIKKIKNHLIIRTNFTGFKKNNKKTFISWLTAEIKKKKKIILFNDMICSTLDVKTCAVLIKKLITRNSVGIYNVGTLDSLSKKNFAVYFAKKTKLFLHYSEKSVNTMSVKRPNNLALDVRKIEKKLKIKMISSKKAIVRLIKTIPKI